VTTLVVPGSWSGTLGGIFMVLGKISLNIITRRVQFEVAPVLIVCVQREERKVRKNETEDSPRTLPK
jgi:hypothetical protein